MITIQNDFTLRELECLSEFITSRLDRGKITLNQARAMLGLKPIENIKGGINLKMISIINEVSLKPLNEELYARVKSPKYLIMSGDTLEAVKDEAFFEMSDHFRKLSENRGFHTYRGVLIAICNSLPFGSIDIID